MPIPIRERIKIDKTSFSSRLIRVGWAKDRIQHVEQSLLEPVLFQVENESTNRKMVEDRMLVSLRGFAASAIIWGLNPAKLGLTCPGRARKIK